MIKRLPEKHASVIIGGKLYKTESAEIIGCKDERTIFRTLKGNYFSARSSHDCWTDGDGNTRSQISYYSMNVENEATAKEVLGKYNINRYAELFGAVEEA